MKKIFTILTSLIVLITFSFCLLSQELNVVGVNPYRFPEVKIKFRAIGSGNDTLKAVDFSGTDIWVTEDGKDKFGKVECPGEINKFSLIIVCDISGSMNDKPPGGMSKIDIAKQLMSQFIDNLPAGRFECAILAYHRDVYTISGFTDNKAELYKSLKSDSLNPFASGSDLNSALLWDTRNPAGEGALLVARKAKYKPFIFLISDGHQGSHMRPDIMVEVIEKYIAETESELSLLTLSPQDELAPSEVDALMIIFPKIYWNKTSDAAASIFNEILKRISVSPCVFTFETDCSGGGNIIFNIDNSKIKASENLNYTIPESEKNILQLNKNNIKILNTMKKTESVIVVNRSLRTAQFSGPPKLTDESFKIINPVNWQGRELQPNNVLGVQIEYTNPEGDSSCHEADIILESNSCKTDTIHFSAGWIFGRQADLGQAKVNQGKTVEYKSVFCNNSCEPLVLNAIMLQGNDKSFFDISQISLPTNIESGECLDLSFEFKPIEEREYSANISYQTNNGVFQSKATGKGIGALDAVEPAIDGNEPLIMIHPNPATINLMVNIAFKKETDLQLVILGMDGRMFFRDFTGKALQYNRLHNISFLPAGAYILQVITESGSYERVFIKN